ncbi:hypothetical protein ACTXGW_03570 [Psychrobacter faecalis]|uniref:hypothetical protein n=1 Tax=Psychrobacter faecalis TaxID=180588 RepID=UPI003FD37A94
MHDSIKRLHEVSGHARKKDIAGDLGVSAATITNWAKRGISTAGALDAANFYGVDANYILDGDVERKPTDEVDIISSPNGDMSNRYVKKIPLLNPLALNYYSDVKNMSRQPFEPSWVDKPSHLSNESFVYTVTGRKMQPVFMIDDQLYIETDIDVEYLCDGNYLLLIKDGHTGPVIRKLVFGENSDEKLLVEVNDEFLGAKSESLDEYNLIGIVDSKIIKYR